MLNYTSFALAACFVVLFRLPKRGTFDAIFVFQPSPITVGIPAALARFRYRAPLLFWVLDLWPDSLRAVGVIQNESVLKLIAALARFVYRRCDLILAASKGFIPAITHHGVSAERVRYFPNWGESVFEPKPETYSPPVTNELRITYAGNIGEAQDFPTVLDAITTLGESPAIRWTIIGDGRAKPSLQEEILKRGLDARITLVDQQPLSAMPAAFAAADVLFLSLRADPTFAKTIPGKLQSYLAAGRPILAMLDGEGAKVLEESGAGIVCPPGDAAALTLALRQLAQCSQQERAAMGQRGREYFETHFSRGAAFAAVDEWLQEVTTSHG